MRQIQLHHFIARDGTGVGYANGDSDRTVRSDLRLAHLCVGIIERRKTQTVSERVKRRLREVAIRAARHGGIAKRRKLHDGLIKRDRKSSRGIVFAGKNISDGGATLLAGIRSLKTLSH